MKAVAPPLDVAALRRQFPALSSKVDGRGLVYLDSACTALKSARVADRMSAFYRELGACGGKRSTHLLAQAVEKDFQEARAAAASFLNAERPGEIVFTSGTTEGVNLVARAFPYEAGRREVVLTDLEHNAVFLPFYEAARRGEITLKFCRSRNGLVEPADMARLITDKTALVAFTRASNVAGGVQPAAEICRKARSVGAAVLVDAAQYLSTHREDVQALGADFVVFSAHKLGGPFGLGVLYGKEQSLNRLGHYKLGGGVVKSVSWPKGEGQPEVVYLDAPMRFEAGVANFATFGAFTEALRLLESLPVDAVRAHVSSLVSRVSDGLARHPHLRMVGSRENAVEGSLVSFHPLHEDFSLHDFNLYLNHELGDRFVAVRSGEHCAHLLHQSLGIEGTMRVSFFAYNTAEEADVFLGALEAYVREAIS